MAGELRAWPHVGAHIGGLIYTCGALCAAGDRRDDVVVAGEFGPAWSSRVGKVSTHQEACPIPLVSHFYDVDVTVVTPDSRVSWFTSAGTNGSLP